MELTVTMPDGTEVGMVEVASGDFEWGVSDNSFQVTVRAGDAMDIPDGSALHDPASGVGGLVLGREATWGARAVALSGVTWAGVIDGHVIGPDPGHAYLSASGDVSDVISTLLSRMGLLGPFRVAGGRVGVQVSHTFTGSRDAAQQDSGRYMGGWAAIWQLLLASGCSCDFRRRAGVVELLPHRARDLTDAEAVSAGVVIVTSRRTRPTNHLVCLGKGELADRQVAHVYADAKGAVSATQTLFGAEELSETYEAATADDLVTAGMSRLRKLQAAASSVRVSVREGVTCSVGDVVGGTDPTTGEAARAIVTGAIARVGVCGFEYEYKTTER